MCFPPPLGSIQDIKEREQKAFNTQAMWHDQLEDVYDYFLPNRNLFDDQARGQQKQDRIFHSTALTAILLWVSKALEKLPPVL